MMGVRGRKNEQKWKWGDVLSAFRTMSSGSKFRAISWPSAGASKTLLPPPRRQTPGGRGEPEGRAVPHTHLLFFLANNLSSSSALSFSHSHTRSRSPLSHTHVLPPLSSHPFFLSLLFLLFALFLSHTLACSCSQWARPPDVPRVRRRLQIPGSLAVGLQESRPSGPKSHPSFPLISERTSGKFLGKKKKKKSRTNGFE